MCSVSLENIAKSRFIVDSRLIYNSLNNLGLLKKSSIKGG